MLIYLSWCHLSYDVITITEPLVLSVNLSLYIYIWIHSNNERLASRKLLSSYGNPIQNAAQRNQDATHWMSRLMT